MKNYVKPAPVPAPFINPHLLYGIEFWEHDSESALNRILVCQKKALRVVLKWPPSSTITCHNIQITFKMLFKCRLLIFVYTRFKNGKKFVDSLKIAHRIITRTKNKQLKLPREESRNILLWSPTSREVYP